MTVSLHGHLVHVSFPLHLPIKFFLLHIGRVVGGSPLMLLYLPHVPPTKLVAAMNVIAAAACINLSFHLS